MKNLAEKYFNNCKDTPGFDFIPFSSTDKHYCGGLVHYIRNVLMITLDLAICHR